jgi:HEAT repeat protein
MGFFDFFSAEKRSEKRLDREIKSANNKFKPKDYRQVSLQNVIAEARKGNPKAVAGLLARFTVVADPTIEDEKEKEWVFDALVEIGEKALPEIRKALRRQESVSWIQRVLRNVVSAEAYRAEMLSVLEEFDTEYERNPDRKLQTIMALADIVDSDVTQALLRFLEDVDETVRYQTVTALARQGMDSAREPLLKVMCEDESIRVRNQVVEAFARLGWLTTGFKKKVDAILPGGFAHDKTGKIVKLGSS